MALGRIKYMDSKITINIVEPGSGPTPDPVVPNTGLFTSGIGGPEATAIGAVLILTTAAIVVAFLYRKQKKSGKETKLVHLVDSTKAVLKSKKRITAGLSAIALLASAGTLTTLLASANKDNTNAVEEDGLTLDVTGGDITIEVSDEPVFAVAEVKATVKEATQAGYTLTAYTDNTDLVSTTDSSKVIPMVAVDEGELVALADNTYGLALAQPETKDDEVYTTLSTDLSNPTILKAIDDYSSTPANDTTTIYYGFYITPDVPYGTYTGTNINYNVEPHYITNLSFNGNGNDGGETIEGMTIIAGDTITLPENTYTKEGYNFIGWNTVAEPTEQDPGEAYADQADYTATEGETKDVTLYAQWEEDLLYMQNVSEWGSSLEIGDEIIAVDNRDNKEYYVARLADGNIWMTQNLDLDIEAGRTYTSADTDLANSASTSWTPIASEATYPTGTTTWNNSKTEPESYDPGNLYWNGAFWPTDEATCTQYGGTWESPGYKPPYCDGANLTTSTGDSHYHIGNYYNWTAAVAMSDSSSYTTDQQDVNQSICPAGWRLPTYSDNKSYQNLVDKQSLTAGTSGNIQNSPVYFVYGGYWKGSSINMGTMGSYWSSVVRDSGGSCLFGFRTNGELGPRNYNPRSEGDSLRCVAR